VLGLLTVVGLHDRARSKEKKSNGGEGDRQDRPAEVTANRSHRVAGIIGAYPDVGKWLLIRYGLRACPHDSPGD